MILALDVGNTNITCGVFDGDRIKASFRITTKMPRTSDEYGMLLSTLLERNQVGMDDIHDAIICSVVPNIMHSLQNGLIKYFNIRPIIVEAGIKTGIRIATPNPQQIGADRIVDAVAAYELYGGPVLVIDFGTATTYDMVDENGTFMGGITAPGIRISAKALWEDAAKLPEIEIKKPDNILGNYHKHAGGTCVWTDRTDRVYHQQGKGRNRHVRCKGCSDRRTRQNNIQ